MIAEMQKEKICVNKIIGRKKEIIEAKGDVIVPDIKPDILNSISASGVVCITKKEILDGKIRIEGSVNTYIMYLADDENSTIRSLNTEIEFSEIINFENCKNDMILDEITKLKNIECKVLNGRKISISANIELDISVYSNSNVEIITKLDNIEDAQILKKEVNLNSIVGVRNK